MSKVKDLRRKRIKMRIRKRLNGTSERPRLSVFRSNKEIYAQIIDDSNEKTITSTSSIKISKEGKTKSDIAKEVGQNIANLAKEAGVNTVVFDRSGYLFHGRVKALAEGARENGLIF